MDSKYYVKKFLLFVLAIILFIFLDIFNVDSGYSFKISAVVLAISIIFDSVHDIRNKNPFKSVFLLNLLAILLCIFMILR